MRRTAGVLVGALMAAALLVSPAAYFGAAHAQNVRPKVLEPKRGQPAARGRVPSRPKVTETKAPTAEPIELSRSILALYDGEAEPSPDETKLHKLLEMPLNHLGYRLTYWDVRQGLPTMAEARRHKAVATWFGERIPHHQAYLAWARIVAELKVRFIVMDFVGGHTDDSDLPAVNAFLAHIGIAVKPIWVEPSTDLRIHMHRESTFGFERPLEPNLPGYMVYRPVKTTTRSHIVVAKSGETEPQGSHPVVTSAGGGFAAYGFAALYDTTTERWGWVVNPFEFLAQALGTDEGGDAPAPVPDTTTLVGRRIYFSHIDGDGWNSFSQVTRPNRPDSLVSEIVLEDLIKAYPDLPVSIGVIAGDVDEALAGKPRGARTAREFYRLPHVEGASHSYSHPYNWGEFAQPNRELELEHQKAAEALRTDPLRAYAKRPFDLVQEVAGALDVSAALSPVGKRPALYLWSGNTRPFAQAIRASRDYGVRNLNGGDSRLDAEYPSVAYLSPLARQTGGERQIYSGLANETIFTKGWSAPFDRFRQLTESVRNTESPRRLKPFNVYYHMYSGERPESVEAVRQHLEEARLAPVAPIQASHYAAIADSFFEVRIVTAARDTWRISNRGELHTLRFDDAANWAPDYARSTGVLGHVHKGAALYVALDPAVSTAVLAVQRPQHQPVIAGGFGRPVLVESRWPLLGLQATACGFDVGARGYGPGQMTWSGVRPGAYTVTASGGNKEPVIVTADADASGRLTFVMPADAIDGVRLSVRCRTAG